MEQTKWCPRCGEEQPITDFYVNKGRSDGLSPLCVKHHREACNKSARVKRIEFLQTLGGACELCGFMDYRALQVDHINGDGHIERILAPNTAAKGFKEKVLSNRSEYALLCANCNIIKKIEQEEFGDKSRYVRTIPTQKLKGIGKGNSLNGVAALLAENERRTKATHCKHGHELVEENIYLCAGRRRCRECMLNAQRRTRSKRRDRTVKY